VTNYVYDPANHLTGVNGQAYTWDDDGNLVNDGAKAYTYDQANRLKSVNGSGVAVTYAYNGDGARLRQIIAGVPTTYTQDLVAPLPVILQAQTGTATTQYLYGLGTHPLAQRTTAWDYLLPDALGSVRQIADVNGYLIRTQDNEPYGSVLSRSPGQHQPFLNASRRRILRRTLRPSHERMEHRVPSVDKP
jgi:YD repeat-containing protein